MMIIENKHEIGDTVYLVTDEDQKKRIVVSIWVKPGNNILYELSQGNCSSYHYEFELSAEKDVLITSNN